ncbi:hypothetical protein ACHMW6_18860 [Pseudoduganella sp. UC29_106]|uniref:hypothetical protein n=1 Tax=Pseudoduganella sp. UC29_106 TaxID=3374553 RepID=UPI0037583ADE
MAQPVQFAGSDAGLDEGGDVIEHLGPKAACQAHAFDVFGRFDGNGHFLCFAGNAAL